MRVRRSPPSPPARTPKARSVRSRAAPFGDAVPGRPTWVHLPSRKVLAIVGTGRPDAEEFQQKLRGLFSIAFTIKFDARSRGHDFRVSPLESRWWLPPGRGTSGRESVRWRLQMPVPRFVQQSTVDRAMASLRDRHGPTEAERVRLSSEPATDRVQLLHLGPYSQEATDLRRMRVFLAQEHRRPTAWHEEIYLSDPRRTPPNRLRTILRMTPMGHRPSSETGSTSPARRAG